MLNSARPIVVVLTLALFLAACAAMQQQKAQATRADTGEFHNLQVFPSNITHDELIANMRMFARSLGTRCDHCHAANPAGSAEAMNFASDAKREKNVARTMLRMTRTANVEYLSKVNPHGQTVTCNTCHRGHTVPDAALPAENSGAAPAPRD